MAYEVSRAAKTRNVFAERLEAMTLRRGFDVREGQRVLVVEDVVTTGGSVRKCCASSRTGRAPGVAGVMVDRTAGAVEFAGSKASSRWRSFRIRRMNARCAGPRAAYQTREPRLNR